MNPRSRDQETAILTPNAAGLAKAADLLHAGALVAVPTETVYGLGADARNGKAVAEIYAAKGRPSFNPLIVHVASAEAAQSYVEWSDAAQKLVDAFWPGPLTLVLPLKPNSGISSLVTAGLDTLAVRVPANTAAKAILETFGGPVAAPSANPSGRISPTTAQHVIDGLNGRIAAVIDAGPCTVGLESTIVGLSDLPQLLRPGGLASEEIEAVLGQRLGSYSGNGAITAPGQMKSHYAPKATVRLNAENASGDEVFLGFGDMPCDLNLSPSENLTEAASNLFSYFHQLDETGRPIAVATIPDTGLGIAINDRLRRAAAPR